MQQQRHVADLVQEERAALGLADAAQAAALLRAGVGAGGVAEQLCLDQRFRDGRAVDGHEGPAAPRPAVVAGPGEDFLADARFALDEQCDGLVQNAAHLLRGAAPLRVARVAGCQRVHASLGNDSARGRALRGLLNPQEHAPTVRQAHGVRFAPRAGQQVRQAFLQARFQLKRKEVVRRQAQGANRFLVGAQQRAAF